MKSREMKFAALIAMAIPSAALAAGGVEWGNGDAGFSSEVPTLELPFKEPLEVSEKQCRLFFADSVTAPVHERFKKNEKGEWCALGEVERGGLFKKRTKSVEWVCAENGERMIRYAIDDFKLGMRCETVRRTASSAEEYMSALPLPSQAEMCGPALLSPEPIRVFAQVAIPGREPENVNLLGLDPEYLFSELLKKAENGPAEQLLRDYSYKSRAASWLAAGLAGEWRHLRFSFEANDVLGLYFWEKSSFEYKWEKGRLNLVQAVQQCRRDPEMRDTGVRIAVTLSQKDRQTIAAMEHALNTSPAATLMSFNSHAELLHFRARNQQLLAQLKEWKESHPQAAVDGVPDPRFELQRTASEVLDVLRRALFALYEDPNKLAGGCNPYDYFAYMGRIGLTGPECALLDQSIVKVRDRLERLKFAFPNPIPKYDPAGCQYVVDIAATIRDLHNRFFVFHDFPVEFYGTKYAMKILETMRRLNDLKYRDGAPGEFLETVLPRWREVCKAERPEIENILAQFKVR